MIEVGAFLIGTESELVLKSRFFLPSKFIDAGFSFTFPEWPAGSTGDGYPDSRFAMIAVDIPLIRRSIV